eukprot:5070240-Amphidinium_carterae.1
MTLSGQVENKPRPTIADAAPQGATTAQAEGTNPPGKSTQPANYPEVNIENMIWQIHSGVSVIVQ